ncbi:MAG: GTPase domain-containing protein [Desulfuromonadaceae bacterium]|nr:GTPase domain-containing protein [Desulfuromonadaceae bacterium]MDD2848019.1 GTPase domain-containing protein [Desulfuromonadaceae bacterium]MDD4131239.1 GTPase domain-containing protein [Desulfuromonadaceae bacterium]
MIEFDEQSKRLVLKLVYYGPALSGKTTNLLMLHDQLSLDGRGELMLLDTTEDRTIYFDLLPFFYVAPSGMKIKLKVYTVPGQVRHDATRKAVLQRADGVVFVADSLASQMSVNFESFDNLEKNLALVGLSIERLPLVVQFNKRDLPDIVAEDEVRRAWGPSGLPVFMASALKGWGVLETFQTVLGLTFDAVNARHGLTARFGVEREAFLAEILRVQQ